MRKPCYFEGYQHWLKYHYHKKNGNAFRCWIHYKDYMKANIELLGIRESDFAKANTVGFNKKLYEALLKSKPFLALPADTQRKYMCAYKLYIKFLESKKK